MLLGSWLTMVINVTMGALVLLKQWELFFSFEHSFKFFIGPTEILGTAIVVHLISFYTGPILWQEIISFGFIPGFQVNHIFFMVTIFFLVVNIIGSFRTGLFVRKKLSSSLYLNDNFIEVHEALWIFVWWMSSIAFSYSSDYIFITPRLFLFNLQLVHVVLLNHFVLCRTIFGSRKLFHWIILIPIVSTALTLLPAIEEIYILDVSLLVSVLTLSFQVAKFIRLGANGNVQPTQIMDDLLP